VQKKGRVLNEVRNVKGQVVSLQLFTVKTGLHAHGSPCGIYGGQSSMLIQVVILYLFLNLCLYLFTLYNISKF
jgi:hypothetical protein